MMAFQARTFLYDPGSTGQPRKRAAWAVSCFGVCLNAFFCSILGCAPPPNLKLQEKWPNIIKSYRHVTLPASATVMKNTGITLEKGDVFSILVSGKVFLRRSGRPESPAAGSIRCAVGDAFYWRAVKVTHADTDVSHYGGPLYMGVSDGGFDYITKKANRPNWYQDNSGSFSVDIIVWRKEDYARMADFFEKMKKAAPDNKAVSDAFDALRRFKEIQVAQAEATKEIEETKKKLESLKQDTVEKPDADPTVRPGFPESEETEEIVVSSARQERITRLERKLVVLMEKITDLERMRERLAAERRKRRLLAKAVEEKTKKEQALVAQLRKGSASPPVIVIASPKGDCEVAVNIITITGVVEDDSPLAALEIFVNGERVKPETNRGIAESGKQAAKRAEFKAGVRLKDGVNRILVRASSGDGLVTEKRLTVRRIEEKTNIWAVVIGIDAYPNVRKLKYAVNDARLIRTYLSDQLGVRPENMVVLFNREATLTRIKSALGTDIKNKAGQDDMVLIFFAGHGATEKDVTSPDGDGLEKYLLPYDADPRDLYATALPMDEISKIFRRIRSERLVFIADACYSGASGGRTVGISGVRANLSDHFLERIASGKGRVILTASGANEVSAENDALKHGVFTYYLVEGLKGTADRDRDGLITVSEAYQYVSEQVPRITGQAQHPVKKGTVEGRLILGVAGDM